MESSIPSGPRAEPLAKELFTCLSEAVDDQLRVTSDFSVLTALMTMEVIIPCSLHKFYIEWIVQLVQAGVYIHSTACARKYTSIRACTQPKLRGSIITHCSCLAKIS